MHLQEYISSTDATIVYPETVEQDYLVHGFVDEAGELAEILRFGTEQPLGFMDIVESHSSYYVAPATNDVKHEAGDVMWYLARIIKTEGFDVDYSWCARTTGNIKAMREETAKEELPLLAAEHAEAVFLLASKYSGFHKKQLRGDDTDYTDKMERIVHEVIRGLISVSILVGYEFQDMLESNISKLMSRKERGVIAGSGSNR